MTTLAVFPKFYATDSNGNPLNGGKLYTYVAGTTTPLATYTDQSGSTPNANPVILDASGLANVWLGSASYKMVLKTSADVTLWTVDNIKANPGDTAVIATGSTENRTLSNRFADQINVKDFGAKGDGSTDDVIAITAADTYGPLIFPKGTYVIGNNLTIANHVTMLSGAKLQIASGKTVTFNGGFDAPVGQVFSGSGAAAFSSKYVITGYPEWWGATTNLGADCTAALNACFTACSITQLQPADYYVSTILKLNTPGRILRGTGCFYNGVTGDSTRIVSLSGSSNIIQVGPDAQPGAINLYTQGISLEDFEVSRAVAPVISSNCVGIKSQWTLYQRIKNVKSVESLRGFEYVGTVACHTHNCWSFRSSAGTGAGTDYWYGYYINGNGTIPASGGNASIYFGDNNANCVLAISNSNGYYLDGNWADTSIVNAEVTGCATGYSYQGNGSAVLGYGETDTRLINAVCDGYTFAGIDINNMSKFGTLTINTGFTAASSTATPTASIYVRNSTGQITINGIQHVMGNNTSTTAGLLISSSNNVMSIGNVYQECSTYPVLMTSAGNCTIIDRTCNHSRVALAIAQMTSSGACKIEMSCTGVANGANLGYQLVGAGNVRNEVNCTGINSSIINGGSTNKLQINGVAVTVTGLSGTNLVSGVMT